jgi:polyvinyl alcohol dehydrogenase (cytochrome)
VLFLGGADGRVRALSAKTGEELWGFDTQRSFDTVDKVPAKGGSMSSQGVTVAGGMVFAGSGYSVLGPTQAGNVLLAFGL